MHRLVAPDRRGQFMGFTARDEDAYMAADALLFIDHAEAHAGKAPVKIEQNFLERRALSADRRGAPGIIPQWARNIDRAAQARLNAMPR
jgi:hypothetical protein